MRNPLPIDSRQWLGIEHSRYHRGLVIDWLPWTHPYSGRLTIAWRRDPWMPYTMRRNHHPIHRLGPLRVVIWPLRKDRS